MRIRLSPPEDTFPQTAGINDALDRVSLARRLTSLYTSLEGSSVAILHGRWGIGKSIFAKRWLKALDAEGFGTIYFDAFAHDYMGEPFDALLSEVLRKGKDLKGRKSERFEKLKDKAAAVSRALAVTGVKAGIRVATLNAIDAADLEALKDASSGVSGDVADAAKEAAKKLLERRATDVAAFEAFRKALADIHEAAGAREGDSGNHKKTIFVIDELDRCRPDFALSLLECLKHFFRTEGLHFVLVTYKDYLSKSVDARYGLGSNSDEYLQKFFDFVIHFEEKSDFDYSNRSSLYVKSAIRNLLKGQNEQILSHIEENLAAYTVAFDLTLRQVEHVATNLALSYLAFDENGYNPVALVIFLAYLKALHPGEFSNIKLGKLDFKNIKSILAQGRWPASYPAQGHFDLIQYHMDPDVDLRDPCFSVYERSLSIKFIDRQMVLPFLANNVLDNFSRS